MRKLFILVLMVLVGIGLVYSNVKADESRTIPFKSKASVGADTVVVAHGGTLYKVTGFASSANATYSIHDTSTIYLPTTTNVLCEGGEATQYDSLATIDFGEEGIPFNTGLVVKSTTANITVIYR